MSPPASEGSTPQWQENLKIRNKVVRNGIIFRPSILVESLVEIYSTLSQIFLSLKIHCLATRFPLSTSMTKTTLRELFTGMPPPRWKRFQKEVWNRTESVDTTLTRCYPRINDCKPPARFSGVARHAEHLGYVEYVRMPEEDRMQIFNAFILCMHSFIQKTINEAIELMQAIWNFRMILLGRGKKIHKSKQKLIEKTTKYCD